MIKGFADTKTEKIFHGKKLKRFNENIQRRASRKLDLLNYVNRLEQLRIPPGNELEKLKGNLKDFWSIRVNDQYRIIFKWENGFAYEVKFTDYH